MRRLSIAITGWIVAGVLGLGVAAPRAEAQCTFEWKPGDGVPGVGGTVYAMTEWDPDGAGPQPPLLVVGGEFSIAGDVLVNHIAAWNGTSWSALGTGMNDDVRALTVYNGNLIAGGTFTTAGGTSASRIAQWNGTSWSALGTGINEDVRALTVYDGPADLVVIPEFDGELGILYDRAPLLAKLGAGRLRVANGNQEELWFVDGGFAQVLENQTVVLTKSATMPGDCIPLHQNPKVSIDFTSLH